MLDFARSILVGLLQNRSGVWRFITIERLAIALVAVVGLGWFLFDRGRFSMVVFAVVMCLVCTPGMIGRIREKLRKVVS